MTRSIKELDNLPLSELCAPVSAKVMPTHATYGTSNGTVSPRKALAKQRQSSALCAARAQPQNVEA